MLGPCLHGSRACRQLNTAALYVYLEEYLAITISRGSSSKRFASVKCLCNNVVVNNSSSVVTAAVTKLGLDLNVLRLIISPCILR
jgi:hypothetical protein